MGNWQKTLLGAIRDDYVGRNGESCVYRYFEEKAAENPRVKLKRAWAQGCAGDELVQLLAELAMQTSQPADVECIEALSGANLGSASSKRQANKLVLTGLQRVRNGAVAPKLSAETASRIAQCLCRLGGKAGKNTTVQALSSLWDYRAGDGPLVVGDEIAINADADEKELLNCYKSCLSSESEQLLFNLGVPITGREGVRPSRVSEVPTRLIELAMKEIEYLPRELGIAATASAQSAEQCSEAEAIALAEALGTQFQVAVPICMDALTGFSLCILSVDFAFDLSAARLERFFKGAYPIRSFFAVIPQLVLNRVIDGAAKAKVPEGEYPTHEMLNTLWGYVLDAWVFDERAQSRPVSRFLTQCGSRHRYYYQIYAERNSFAPSECPASAAPFFERL